MSTTLSTQSSSPRSSRSRTLALPVGGHGAAGCVVALAVIEAYAGIARSGGVPMRAGFPGAHAAKAVTAGSFATGVLVAAFWGTVLAMVLARYAKRPARTFTIIAIVGAVLSLITPLGAVSATTGTKLTLAGAHLIVAGIMIPTLRRGVSRR